MEFFFLLNTFTSKFTSVLKKIYIWKKKTKKSKMESVPSDILIEIFLFLHGRIKDLIVFSITCKKWNRILGFCFFFLCVFKLNKKK